MNERGNLRIVVTAVGGNVTALQRRIVRIAPRIAEVAVCEFPSLLREVTRFNDYDAVLLDWRSGAAGAEAVAGAVSMCPIIPVIVVSTEAESQVSEQMLRLGAQDYLVKRETNGTQLLRAIHHAMERKRLDIRLKTTLGELGEANSRLRSLALRDTLTGALNRRAFFAIGGQMLNRARQNGQRLALLYCDLDRFKQINDNLGHAVGDAVLRGFRERCARTLRRGDNLARLGGDEFVILLDAVSGDAALETAKRIRAAFEQPLLIDPHRIQLRPSIGLAQFPECDTIESLIACADQAMYAAKRGPGIACYAAEGVERMSP